ncbi:MAG: TetR/AcrR family transcriptional regulator [Phycisphaeraceae bacterium]|nr:TetR/AcrR family transcriptional regulator [Phycisphaeraceae bacterium]
MTRSVSELFGHPPPAQTGRERLIAAGIDLFYRLGFQAVGLDHVIEHAGVTKTTFYKHFESKDDFVLACVETRDAWEMVAWDRAARALGGDAPRGQLLGFFDVLDAWFNDAAFRGCMFISAAAEYSDRRDPIHRAAASHKRKVRDHFRALAVQGGAADPDAFADHFTILLEGTLLLRHVHDRNDAARVVRPAVVDLLDRSFPAAGAGGEATARSGH